MTTYVRYVCLRQMRSFALFCLFLVIQTLHMVARICCEQLKWLHWLVTEEYVIVLVVISKYVSK